MGTARDAGGMAKGGDGFCPSFGTNGIRGTLEDITPDFVVKLCAAFATWVENGEGRGVHAGGLIKGGKGPFGPHPVKVLVARDTRTTGELVEGAVVSGLLWAGAQPVLLGVMPSPAVEFLGAKRGLPSIIITSSHNPPEWVALKFNDSNGINITKERGAEIEEVVRESGWRRAKWDELPPVLKDEEALDEYVNVVSGGCGRLEGLSVVIDCGNGTAGRAAPRVFKGLGAKVRTLNAQEDGFFPGRGSEPTEANVQGLISAVREFGADIGIAYDGDADRVALIDEGGNYVLGDKVFALAIRAMIDEGRGGDVVTTVATSNIIREIVSKNGGRVKYVKVGAPYIAEEMHREGANYMTGGEEVGGIIWPDVHPGKDGILSSAKIAAWLARKKSKLSEEAEKLPKYHNIKQKIECGKERFPLMRKLQDKYRNSGNALVIDGVRLDFDDGWCIARASGTENYIRVFAEAKSRERAEELAEMLEEEVLGI